MLFQTYLMHTAFWAAPTTCLWAGPDILGLQGREEKEEEPAHPELP